MKSGGFKLTVWVFIFFMGCKMPLKEVKFEHEGRIVMDFNASWKFFRTTLGSDSLIYDVRPPDEEFTESKDADSRPEEALKLNKTDFVLKPWIMPTGNPFIKEISKHYQKPAGWPGQDFPFVKSDFNDQSWESVTLPHDWAIKGPFMEGPNPDIGGGMGRLPVHGVGWYRKKLFPDEKFKNKKVFLEIDGAMSYSMVWVNGYLAGGWPYGYNSYQLDITPYLKFNQSNQISVRVDNPPKSARWYPGAGLYRDVRLVLTEKVHVSHWGSTVRTENVSKYNANIQILTQVENHEKIPQSIRVISQIFELNKDGSFSGNKITETTSFAEITPGASTEISQKVTIANPKLWGPALTQEPNLYIVKTRIFIGDKIKDDYYTKFGIRDIQFHPDKGLLVNGESIKIKGVNQHHDLGALGAAFNYRAAERQLEILREAGCNSIRTAHNPPDPQLLDLTDKMGFLVVNEIFDSWERKKTPYDFHLIFPEWYEQDLRSFVRRDRNHPSVILWSYGNEVGEQYTEEAGAQLSRKLKEIVKDEDPTRYTTVSQNYAKPFMPFTKEAEVISLNYQGEGIRNALAYKHLKGINTEPLYQAFKNYYPDRAILSSETASAFSSRGTYLFPVDDGDSAPISEGKGGDSTAMHVSAYELYTANFGSSADKVFSAQDRHPFVGGEWVWSGWDYLGEPTPYYNARSSYCGFIDLAGFPKDRFYLYQSRWKPNSKVAHLLPHWNWPERIGKVTPVHLFTSGDEAELFLNGKSLGKKKKKPFEYRLRWDDVLYQPGEIKAIVYKDGKEWAEASVKTTGKPYKIKLSADRNIIKADGRDLSFITAEIFDQDGNFIRNADNLLSFEIQGQGKIIATDNGDSSDMNPFHRNKRRALSGKALAIVRGDKAGKCIIVVKSDNLLSDKIMIDFTK
jgi:beta-galactosidase